MTTRHPAKKRSILLLIIGIYAVFPWLSGHTFLQYMKVRHNVSITGFWFPSYFPIGGFHISHLRAEWKQDFQILSGELDVRYNPFLFSISRGGVSLKGREMEVSVKKVNANLKTKSPFTINRFDAELELRPNAEPFIHSLEIDSPVIQFKISGQSA